MNFEENETICLRGNTFPHKANLTYWGFNYEPDSQVWVGKWKDIDGRVPAGCVVSQYPETIRRLSVGPDEDFDL